MKIKQDTVYYIFSKAYSKAQRVQMLNPLGIKSNTWTDFLKKETEFKHQCGRYKLHG